MRRTLTAAKALAVAGALMAGGHSAAQAQIYWDPAFYATGTSVTVTYMGASAQFFDVMQWFKVPFSTITYHPIGGPTVPDIVNYEALGGVSGGTYENLFSNKNHTLGPTKSFNNLVNIVNASAANNVGDVKTLSTIAGHEVLLGLFVDNELAGTGKQAAGWFKQDLNDYTFFTGPGRNVDNYFHLKVQKDLSSPNTFNAYGSYGGWEDIRGGGDNDYNDLMFKIQGVSLTNNVTPEPATMVMLGTGLFSMAGAAAAKRRRRKEIESV